MSETPAPGLTTFNSCIRTLSLELKKYRVSHRFFLFSRLGLISIEAQIDGSIVEHSTDSKRNDENIFDFNRRLGTSVGGLFGVFWGFRFCCDLLFIGHGDD